MNGSLLHRCEVERILCSGRLCMSLSPVFVVRDLVIPGQGVALQIVLLQVALASALTATFSHVVSGSAKEEGRCC